MGDGLGALARLPAISNGQTCYSSDNLRTLQRAYPALLLVLAGAFYGWVFWTLRRDRGRLTPEEERSGTNLHMSLLFLFMTVAHPRAWTTNYVALILPCMLLTVQVFRHSLDWKKALGTLALVILVCALWKCPNSEWDWSWSRWLYQSKDFWAALFVAGVCAWSHARRLRRARFTGDTEPSGAREERRSLAA